MAVSWDAGAILSRVRAAAMRGVIRGTENLRTECIRLVLETAKTGKVYRRRGVEHRASAPGEPWASDTGATLAKIDTRYDQAGLAGAVNFGAAHSPALEYGTAKMEPRPVARPAVENKRKDIEADIADEVRKELLAR